MCLRIVLAVTILLIVIFVLVVIAMSGVIVLPEVLTYVMCHQFYHDSTKTTEIFWSYASTSEYHATDAWATVSTYLRTLLLRTIRS